MKVFRHYDYWEGLQREIGFAQAVRLGRQLHISGIDAITSDLQPVAPGDMAGQISLFSSAFKRRSLNMAATLGMFSAKSCT